MQLYLLTLAGILVFFYPLAEGELSWSRITGNGLGNQPPEEKSPGGRAGSSAWVDPHGNLFLFGGETAQEDNSAYANDLWLFNSSTLQWSEKEQATMKVNSSKRAIPKPRTGAAMCGVPGIMLFLFGGKSTDNILYDTWIYTIPSNTWLPLYVHKKSDASDIVHPSARSHPIVWCLNDRAVIHGGQSSSDSLAHDTWEFSFRNLKWKEMHTDAPPPQRCCAASWVTDNALYLFGGKSITTAYNDMWTLNPQKLSWSQIEVTSRPPPRHSCSHWKCRGVLYVSHGKDKNVMNDTWSFDINTKHWGETHGVLSPSLRSQSVAWSFNTSVYLYGGVGYDDRLHLSLLNDMWRLKTIDGNQSPSFIEHFTPALVFLITMASTASVVCVFGMVFCLKKTLNHPRSSAGYNVRYSPLKDEAMFEFS